MSLSTAASIGRVTFASSVVLSLDHVEESHAGIPYVGFTSHSGFAGVI